MEDDAPAHWRRLNRKPFPKLAVGTKVKALWNRRWKDAEVRGVMSRHKYWLMAEGETDNFSAHVKDIKARVV